MPQQTIRNILEQMKSSFSQQIESFSQRNVRAVYGTDTHTTSPENGTEIALRNPNHKDAYLLRR